MARGRRSQLSAPPEETISKVLSECQRTTAVHRRSVGLLLQCRRDHGDTFSQEFFKTITPALLVYKQEPAVTRTINFIAAFASARITTGEEIDADDFVEELLGFLLPNTQSRDKALRYRSTQLVARIMEMLPEEAGISDETWEEVSDHMQARLRDKQPVIRAKAARALARLVEPGEDGSFEEDPVTSAYKTLLTNDKNTDVRKTVVASYPLVAPLLPDVIERTKDVSDVVRKLTYMALGAKMHVSKLTPQQRVDLLRRGLADRSPSVRAECLKMVCNYWFVRDCSSDPLALLNLLDVNKVETDANGKWTHEEVAEKVLVELLGEGHVVLEKGPSLRDYLQLPKKLAGRTPGRASPRSTLSPASNSQTSSDDVASDNENESPDGSALMTPSEALYWRVICQWLHKQAEAQGSDAAHAGGAQAEVMAAESDEKRELLESFLPATVADFVQLTQLHLVGGEKSQFAARQLLALASCLDLTDASGRKAAAGLAQALLCGPLVQTHAREAAVHTLQKAQPAASVDSAVSLLTDRKWARAVSTFARFVHGSLGELMGVLLSQVGDLKEHAERAQDESAAELGWLWCLAVVRVLLEEAKGLEELQEGGATSLEVFEKSVVAQIDHNSPHVRKSALHALALFCHLDSTSAEKYSSVLRAASVKETYSPARALAVKALFDLALRHGTDCLKAAGKTEEGHLTKERVNCPGDNSLGAESPSFQSAVVSRGTSFMSAVSDADAAELMETAQSPFPLHRAPDSGSNLSGVSAPKFEQSQASDPVAFLAEFLSPESGKGTTKASKKVKSAKGKKGAKKEAEAGLEALEIAAEGFAKLLLFDRVPDALDALAQLVLLYFDRVTERCLRLRQCLAVFFDCYAASSAAHKRCIASTLLQVVRLAWSGHSLEEKLTSTAARKKAATLAKFMVQLLTSPPLTQAKTSPEHDSEEESGFTQTHRPVTQGLASIEDEGHEQLALDLGAEILGCPDKKSAAGKAYLSVLGRTMAGLSFRRSEQDAIKRTRKLLDWVLEVLQFDKMVIKNLTALAARLADLDDTPTEPLSEDALHALEGLAEAHMRQQEVDFVAGGRSRRTSRASASSQETRTRASVGDVSSELQDDVMAGRPSAARRPTRQSKAAALTKMGNQKKAAFEGSSDSSSLSDEQSSNEDATRDGEELAQENLRRHNKDEEESVEEDGTDSPSIESRAQWEGSDERQKASNGSSAGGVERETGTVCAETSLPRLSEAEGDSEGEEQDEPRVAANMQDRERLTALESSNEGGSDDASPVSVARSKQQRRRLVEDSSEEEAAASEINESPAVPMPQAHGKPAPVKNEEQKEGASSSESDSASPVVARRTQRVKRRVLLESDSEEEVAPSKTGAIGERRPEQILERQDSGSSSFASAKEDYGSESE